MVRATSHPPCGPHMGQADQPFLQKHTVPSPGNDVLPCAGAAAAAAGSCQVSKVMPTALHPREAQPCSHSQPRTCSPASLPPPPA